MKNLGQLYTLGIWTVKTGNEKAFTDAWQAFAEWTAKNQPGNTKATLLQDVDETQRFISFGPWKDKESIQSWRNQPQFKEFIAKARDLCEDIKPHTLKAVVNLP